jgi:16S rRNA processing protein RimM
LKDRLSVARVGRSVGVKGEMKLNILSDFPQQFKRGATFSTDKGDLTIESYNPKRGTVKFAGIDSLEDAKKYTNAYLYSTQEATKESIKLDDGEFFWFDIIGSDVFENGEYLGRVKDIARLPSCDYLEIETSKKLIEKGFSKKFLIPFLDKFVTDVDVDGKKIILNGAKDILNAS